MKKEKTTKSLLGAWVCELANNLMNECETPMTRTEAFRRAHLARELLENLGKGKVTQQCFYRACYGVFDLLRVNGQLGRREGMFDGEIKKELSSILSEILGDYGDRED